MSTIRKMLITVAALAAIAAGSAAIAGAASEDSTTKQGSTQSTERPQRPNETPLTGDTADKVKKAALAKVPGSTVLRVETDADQGAAYEAHVRKSDGTEVTVLVDKSFKVIAVRTCNGPRDGGPGGDRQRGGPPPSGYEQGGYFQPGPS